jgi:uncharacterized protein with HEPN domain
MGAIRFFLRTVLSLTLEFNVFTKAYTMEPFEADTKLVTAPLRSLPGEM